MRRTLLWLVLVTAAFGARGALADPKPPLERYAAQFLIDVAATGSTKTDPGAARIGFVDEATRVDAAYPEPVQGADFSYDTRQVVIGWSADKQVAWVAADLPLTAGGMGDTKPSVIGTSHGSALIAASGAKWHTVAYAVRGTLPDKDQADLLKDGKLPPPIKRKIDAGAEAVARQFEATIGDPKVFAATVSDRKEVVLYGSDQGDRFEGGAAVAAALTKWNLRLKVRDGVQAGIAGGAKTIAFVAANVDAVPAGAKPGTKPTPYEVLAIYEKTGGAWKLVHAQFAFFGARGF